MKILPQKTIKMEYVYTQLYSFFQRFHVERILRSANAVKFKGFSAVLIFLVAVVTAFQHRSFYMTLHLFHYQIDFGKDTFYRFMSSCHTNWRNFTMRLAHEIIRNVIGPLTSSSRRNVLIIDDSVYSRSRSRKVELLTRIYDHAKHCHLCGFRMLTMGWSDGNTFLPVLSYLLSTSNLKARINGFSSDVDFRSNGGKQRKLAVTNANEVVLTFLREAKAENLPAQHVLFDTWFCSPSSLLAIKEIGYDMVAMSKKTPRTHYLYNGKMQSVPDIYSQSKKRCGRARYLLSVEAEAVKDGKHVPIRLVFVRNRKKKKEYLVLVTTDMSLPEEEIIQLYGKRWGIEVFFKVCKSYLRLSKDCQSLSYDSMTAHVAAVFTRYMFLAVQQRESVDSKSMGELFSLNAEEIPDLGFVEALQLILDEFMALTKKNFDNKLDEAGALLETLIEKSMNKFLNSLPIYWSRNLRKCA